MNKSKAVSRVIVKIRGREDGRLNAVHEYYEQIIHFFRDVLCIS